MRGRWLLVPFVILAETEGWLTVPRSDPRAGGQPSRIQGSTTNACSLFSRGMTGMTRQNARTAASVGTAKNFVLLLRFSDHEKRVLPSVSDINVLFNNKGASPLTPTGSIRDVFHNMSYGQEVIDSFVYPWITLPKTEKYYAAGNSYGRVPEAITYALDYVAQDKNFNFKDFDLDDDGNIDVITYLHSRYAAETGQLDCEGAKQEDRIWSHKWLTATEITESGSYELAPLADVAEAYKIQAGYPDGEYLLIENRQVIGRDAKLWEAGLAIYHIDEEAEHGTEGYPGKGKWPENGEHYKVALLAPDGSFDLEKGKNRGDGGDIWTGRGSATELGPSSNPRTGSFPNTDAYQRGKVKKTGIRIFNIRAAGQKMLFEVEIPFRSASLLAQKGSGETGERTGESLPISTSQTSSERSQGSTSRLGRHNFRHGTPPTVLASSLAELSQHLPVDGHVKNQTSAQSEERTRDEL